MRSRKALIEWFNEATYHMVNGEAERIRGPFFEAIDHRCESKRAVVRDPCAASFYSLILIVAVTAGTLTGFVIGRFAA